MKRLSSVIAMLAGLAVTVTAQAETTLRIGLTAAPPSKGNPFQNLGTTSNLVWPAFYDTLTFRDNDGVVRPALAVSWEQVEPTVWMFHLRPGVTFSNGEPFTAESVKTTFDMLRTDAANGYSWQREAPFYPRVDVIDGLTVAIHTDRVDVLTPRFLSGLYMAPGRYLTDVGYDGLRDEPVGSGPFKVDDWQAARITLSAFQRSWRPPQVDKLEMLVVPDSSARFQALMTGRIDVAIAVNSDQIGALELAGHRAHLRNPIRILVMALQSMDPDSPFHDVRVRQAANYAINMDLITEVLLAGLVEPARQPALPGSVGYVPDLGPYPYDPDKARQLLKDAGFENGFAFTHVAPVNTLPNDTAIFQQIAADLSDVGIDMTVKIVTYGELLRAVIQGDFDGESLSMDFNNRYGDALRPMTRGFNHSCTGPKPWYCNEDIQEVMNRALVAPSMDERNRLSQQVVTHYYETAESIFLFPVPGLDGIHSRVRGWEPWNDTPMLHLVEVD